jgi:hypothetical protein
MATKKPTEPHVTAKLSVPPEVKPLLKDIENKRLLGGSSIDFYLKTAEDDLVSGDEVRVKLGAYKLRHLASLVQSAAARKTAEANDWLSEKQFAQAQRTAENAGQPPSATPSAEPTEYDLKAQEAERHAKALLQFHPTQTSTILVKTWMTKRQAQISARPNFSSSKPNLPWVCRTGRSLTPLWTQRRSRLLQRKRPWPARFSTGAAREIPYACR